MITKFSTDGTAFGFPAKVAAKIAMFVAVLVCATVIANPAIAQQDQEDSVMSHIAPDQCLFYASWAGRGEMDPNSTNETERLMAEPEVQAFLSDIQKRLSSIPALAMRNSSDMKRGLAKTLAPKVLSTLMSQPGAMFVTDVTPGQEGVSIEAAAVMKYGEDASSLVKSMVMMFESEDTKFEKVEISDREFFAFPVPDAPITTKLYFGAVGENVMIAMGKKTVESTLAKMKAKVTPKWLENLKTRAKIERRGSIGFWNIEAGVEKFAPMMGEEGMKIFSALGLNQIKSLETAAGLEGKGMVDRSLIRLTGEPKGLVKLLAGKPLNKKAISTIPADAMFAVAFSLDASEVLNETIRVMEDVAPQQAEEMKMGMESFTGELGFDIQKQFLDYLGSTWTLYNGASDGYVTGLVLTVDVKDEDGMRQSITELTGMLRGMSRNNPEAPRIVRKRYGKTDIFTLSVPDVPLPVQPSWTISNGQMVVTLFPQTLKPIIVQSPDEKYLDVAGYFGKEADNVTGFSYTDTKKQFEFLYSYATMGFGMIPMIADEMGGGPDGEALAQMVQGIELPSSRSIHRHLLPSVSVTRLTSRGIEVETTQTVPTVNVAIAAPIGVALLLPAVQAARSAARRTQSANNLKQQALAMHNYHDTFKGFPAAYSNDKDGKPLLSWRVHILPFMDENVLYEQFHLDEPWDSEHNIKLLDKMPAVYLSPTSNAEPGKTVYLGVGGKNGILSAPKKDGMIKFPKGNSFANIRDGSSNTIMAFEASDALAVEWTKPVEYKPTEKDVPNYFGMYPGGFNAAFGDGSVQFLSMSLNWDDTLQYLFDMNDGQVVDWWER